MTHSTFRRVYSEKYERSRGKDIWGQYVQLASLVCDRMRSSLGPNGMYKMISYNRGPQRIAKITKDASEFLEELRIQYPPATIVSTAAKLQREEVGDGVCSFTILLGALLKNADKMLDMKVHRNVVVRGYRLAAKKALEIINSEAAVQIPHQTFEDTLTSVSRTRRALSTNMIRQIIEASQIVATNGTVDKSKVRFVRKMGGALEESKLIRGVAVCKEKADSNMPDTVDEPRIVLLSGEPGVRRFEVKMQGEGLFPLKVNIKNREDLAKYKRIETDLKMVLLSKLDTLKANVLVCEKPLDDLVRCRLASREIFGLDRLPREDMIALSEATGARLVGSLKDLSSEDLGYAKRVYVEKVGLLRYAIFEGCSAATFLLQGSTTQAQEETELAIQSLLSVLKVAKEDQRVVPGGGAIEMSVALQLNQFSKGFAGKEQIAIRFFADALMRLPSCLSENFGLNPIDALIELKRRHAVGQKSYGIGVKGCAHEVCWDPAKVKMSVVERACEVASLMLRIDEQVMSKEIAKFHKQ